MNEIVKGIFAETEFEGVNVGAVLVEDNLVCIDSPSYPRDARQWSTSLSRIHSRPARFLFLTDCNGDRMLNARWLRAPLVVHQQTADQLGELKRRYPSEWIKSLSQRNPAGGKEISSSPIEPVSLSFSKELKIIVDDFTIVLRHEPGPTLASSWLYLPERKILFSGDSVVSETHPPIAGMNSKKWIESLQKLIELEDVIDVIIPGRGPLTDISSAYPIIEYLQQIRSIVREHLDAGKMQESLSDYVDDLMSCFPVGSLPVAWIRAQITRGLEQVFQEIMVEEYMEGSVMEQA